MSPDRLFVYSNFGMQCTSWGEEGGGVTEMQLLFLSAPMEELVTMMTQIPRRLRCFSQTVYFSSILSHCDCERPARVLHLAVTYVFPV